MEDDPKPADAIFAFGGSSLEVPKRAAELHKKGYAPTILACDQGGTFGGEENWGMPVAQKYVEVMKQKGVNAENIIWETTTGNTFAEARRVIPLMQENEIDPKTVIISAYSPHQRRAYTTIAKLPPDIVFVNCPPDDEFDPDDPDMAHRLVQEVERLHKFRPDRTAEGIKIPWRIQEAAAAIRKYHLKPAGYYDKDK